MKCPKCGSKLREGMTGKGYKFVECEKRVYDHFLKEAFGCDYIEWSFKVNSKKEKEELRVV